MHRRRHPRRRKSHSRRKGSHLRRNPGANKNIALLGLALVGGAAAWYFLSGSKRSTKLDPRNLPQPPGCNGDPTVKDIQKVDTDQYIVGYADGRLATTYPSGYFTMQCKDGSTWELAPGHDWFQAIDAQGNQHKPPYTAQLSK